MRARPAILAVLALVVAVALFFVLREDDSPEPASPSPSPSASEDSAEPGAQAGEGKPAPGLQIELRSGEPEGGIEEIEVESGGRVEFEVTSDVADEVHVHGYDIEKALPPGRPVEIAFGATIEGVFEVESHHFGTQIAELTVAP